MPLLKSRGTTQPRNSRRYCARAYGNDIANIYLGSDLAEAIAVAKRHHEKGKVDTWVWDLQTGETIFRASGARAAGGAA